MHVTTQYYGRIFQLWNKYHITNNVKDGLKPEYRRVRRLATNVFMSAYSNLTHIYLFCKLESSEISAPGGRCKMSEFVLEFPNT